MDQELVAFLEKQFASLRQEVAEQFTGVRGEIASLREETAQRFEQVEDSIRYTQITVEKMRDEIPLLAEGVSGFDEKLDGMRKGLRAEIGEVRDLLTVSYRDLNQRIGPGPVRAKRPRPTS